MKFPHIRHSAALAVALLSSTTLALATPDFVEHLATDAVYGEPSTVTMRRPVYPGSQEAVDLWIRIGFSFYYTNVAIYYTLDGSTPVGSFGVPSGTTSALTSAAGQVAFVRNEPSGGGPIDWWKATLPGSLNIPGRTVKYKVSAWHSGGGPEIFGNNYGCADGTCDDPGAPHTVFEYTITSSGVPWPGKGSPYSDFYAGYPPVALWKEEGVVGNNYMNVQLDQNGTVYDIYYPSAGCVRGMGTKNEGYVDGPDTFPPGLPPGHRGQMNVNQAMGGIRVNGVTYWLSNENGSGYDQVAQSYLGTTNVITTSARLFGGGSNITVQQYDFCPKGITFPVDLGGNPNHGICIKRYILTNHGPTQTLYFYYYADFALNGGDGYDAMFADGARGALVAYDNIERWTSSSGEYNPTTVGDYHKNVSVYLAAALKLCDTVGGAAGTPANGSWRQAGSIDDGQGWVGVAVTLPTGGQRELNVALVGGFDDFPFATGTYDYQIAPALDWFLTNNMSTMQATTENDWNNWLALGVTVDTPDDDIDALYARGLLATALHLDGKNGGLVAGMHNGAYPFVWPRDAVWAAVTFDRTGHTADAAEVYRFLRDIAYRANDTWGKGFWYQKYTTDGHIVWNSPQVDETACVPWGAYYHYLITGDTGFLSQNYTMIYEAGRASSEDSSIDTRLYYDDPYSLMHSNNLWEDAWGDFVYSNASVERGLRDAAAIATRLGYTSDAALFTSRANAIHSGITARLVWDGENTDISHLGLVYPMNVYPANDPLVAHLVDRINGVAGDAWGNIHPIVNYAGEWQGLINRYWADTYWNGGPWFLSTLWYGAYYAQRQDLNAGQGDIDNHHYRLGLLVDLLGPIGLGAEQVAPSNSLLYPGQTDFVLQAAWPNAWESMSFFVDAVMLFLDYTPDAPANTLRLEPKLPSAWNTMTFNNLTVGAHRINVTCTETPTESTHTFVNVTGQAVNYDTCVRVTAGCLALHVTQDGTPIAYSYDAATGRVHVTGPLNPGAGAATVVRASRCAAADFNCDCRVNAADFSVFGGCIAGPNILTPPPGCDPDDFANADLDGDGDVDVHDVAAFQRLFTGG